MSEFVQGRVIQPQTSLTKEQKEAVGLLSIGTFLEYFDLMLYVHLAVLLNDLFFPPYEDIAAAGNVLQIYLNLLLNFLM
ncbi:hypothetical protein [Candidatus Tisiphia endosymbiont of Ditula angustiorana]|uniref:hypothetical protein n=1 Tax=Candidatus Tisiphia endosymbiont of Ditula angustiorana TaxID=3066272 RepID=UPI00312CBCE4